MLTLLDKYGPYSLPTGWHEVATRQFCDLDRLQLRTVEARASYFAGRPIQVNGLVADALAFLLVPPSEDGGHNWLHDLGQETYLQVESIRALVATRPLHDCFAEVYGLHLARIGGKTEYSPDRAARFTAQCPTFPITSTFPAVAHCLAELERLATKYARLAEPDTTEAGRRAREAGADRLQVYGYLLTAKWFAQQYGITLEAALQTSWETIAVHLLLARDEAEIADQLHKNSSHE